MARPQTTPRPAPRTRRPGRGLAHRIARRRSQTIRAGSSVTLFAVLGPGLLAGLSDDDPAGITTYSLLGADYGYRLLWVLALSTVALVVFHELGARMGVVTGQGLLALVRTRFGRRAATYGAAILTIANVGTMCAELAGIAAGAELLFHIGKGVSVPIAAAIIALLVLRGSFKRVEHVLLAVSAVFVTYIASGVLAHPDWLAAGKGLVLPSMPLTRDAVYLAVATVGTTLAPWGIAFIQSYAVDKQIPRSQLGLERVDVITGAALTGVIGVFIVMACAATLHARGIPIVEAADAARGLEPLAGPLAGTLFGVGIVGAGFLAGAIVPMSTAYSVCEGLDRPADVNASLREAPFFYGTFVAVVVVSAAIVLVPGLPLIGILVATQALNAVLVLFMLPFLITLARDRDLMGDDALAGPALLAALTAFAFVALAIVALGYLAIAS
ncbi:MAG: divalent metal cation transporter [Solirubrobacteraceae bacterium]|nr:divalent metal cation transporter [Solirubrobacteraceae bacterium]